MEAFTRQLWSSIELDIMPAIIGHPFLQGLKDGSLDEAAFRQYVLQDSAYLQSFGRGLALLAARAEDSATFMMFCDHARNTLIVEEALHREFMAGWPQDYRVPDWHELPPEALLYTSFLIRVAHERPFHEVVAAFLPCYWIYLEVGRHLAAFRSPNPLYQRWIDTYAGDAFAAVVAEMLALVDALAVPLAATQKQRMLALFRRGSEMEFLFWDCAYRCRQWPFTASCG